MRRVTVGPFFVCLICASSLGWFQRSRCGVGSPPDSDAAGDVSDGGVYLVGAVVSRWCFTSSSEVREDDSPVSLKWLCSQAAKEVTENAHDVFGFVTYAADRVASLVAPLLVDRAALPEEILAAAGDVMTSTGSTLREWIAASGTSQLASVILGCKLACAVVRGT